MQYAVQQLPRGYLPLAHLFRIVPAAGEDLADAPKLQLPRSIFDVGYERTKSSLYFQSVTYVIKTVYFPIFFYSPRVLFWILPLLSSLIQVIHITHETSAHEPRSCLIVEADT